MPISLILKCLSRSDGLALTALSLSVAMSGCGRRITDVNLEQVHDDMSKKQVESILGQPTSVKQHFLTLQTQMKTLPATRYYYEQDGQTVELIFVDDKLVGRNGFFEANKVTPTRVAEKANSDVPIPGLAAPEGAPSVPIETVEPPLPESQP